LRERRGRRRAGDSKLAASHFSRHMRILYLGALLLFCHPAFFDYLTSASQR
jgi:hypothetical protein